MKTFLKSFLAVVFLFSTTFASAETLDNIKIVAGNWENPMPDTCIHLISGNILAIHIIINIADVDLSAAKSMFLRYNFNNMLVGTTAQLTSADFTSISIDGHNLYQADFLFVIDMANECANQPMGQPIDFEYSYKLVTQDPGTVPTLYPVHDYPNLFPSSIFADILDRDYQPRYAGTKQICCASLQPLNGHEAELQADLLPEGIYTNVSSRESENGAIDDLITVDVAPVEIKIFPNPFRDNIHIQLYLAEATVLQCTLLSADCKQIYSQQISDTKDGSFQHTIDCTELPPGFYFLRLSSGNFSQAYKILRFE